MPRNFSILVLGGGEEVLPLLRALAPLETDGAGTPTPDAPTFQVGAWCGCGPIETELAHRYPQAQARTSPDWAPADRELVVVAGYGVHHSQHESHLRDLARDAVPMVVVQPTCSAIFGLELDMIGRDTAAPMVVYEPAALHPAIDWLADLVQEPSQPLGNLDQIVFERSSHQRNREQVLRHLAQDALILRRLMGDFQQVGGMQTGEGASLDNLSIHVTASESAIGRWSIAPGTTFTGGVLRVIGDTGSLELFMPESGPWTVESSATVEVPDWDTDHETRAREHIARGLSRTPTSPSWEDAVRGMDLADVASESVRRGKTLPIRNEIVTEEQTFKGMMAAGGCLIMLLLPLLLLGMSLIDALHIPLTKRVTLTLAEGEHRTYLPADAETLESVTAQNSGRELQLLPSPAALQGAHDPSVAGAPQAYAVMGQDLYVAPIPDRRTVLDVRYEGHFSISRLWLFALLIPIGIFLSLQLLKLAFPAPATNATDES